MTPRNTNTGGVLEAMVVPALERGGYVCTTQVIVGQRCGGRAHKVDAIATRDDQRVLVSMKWQQTGGTAEQKVPFEVMCLADAVRAQHALRAYLVLGGDGWTLRDYFTSGKLADHLVHASLVRVVTLEAFIRIANNGQL
jgi:hypothetical protein